MSKSSTLASYADIVVSVKSFGASGDPATDDSPAIQAAIDSVGSSGGTVYFPPGTYRCDSTISVPFDHTTLLFDSGARVTYSSPTQDLFSFSGDNCTLSGAVIDAPAVFDGTNSQPTYGVVEITGEFFTAEGCIINNVPRLGFFFNNTNNGTITGCKIDGGTSDTFFTGFNTVHFGIFIDPFSSGGQGNFIISDNYITRCVQGGGSGNFGALSQEQSMTVTGNVFELCWNHGWYAGGIANGITVSSNAFNACQVPIALTGSNHAVVGNTLVVATSGSGLFTDNEVTGISLRDPVNCVVANNSIRGESTPGGTVISLDDLPLTPGANKVARNIVSGNVIEITNSDVAGVMAIRLVADSSTVSDNIISSNVIRAPGRLYSGVIHVQGSASLVSDGNTICDNTISITGLRGDATYGIFAGYLSDTRIDNNYIRVEFDATAPIKTLFAILVSECVRACVSSNAVVCSSSYGANTQVWCVSELNSGLDSQVSQNRFSVNTAKASVIPLSLLPGSGTILDHLGSGSPEGAVNAAVGSLWRRTDGGASTTFYVKESGTGSTGWVAK